MPINHVDGQYGLDIYVEKPEEAREEFSDNLTELRARAEELIEAGHFKYIRLSKWNAINEEWDEIDDFEPE